MLQIYLPVANEKETTFDDIYGNTNKKWLGIILNFYLYDTLQRLSQRLAQRR